jgi:proteic killer suppression protein
MEISVKTHKGKKLCEQTKQAEKELGQKGAKKLRTRMAELKAASSVTELCAGRPHPLSGDRKGQFALDLVHPQRVVFEPAHDPIPRKNDESNQDEGSEDKDSEHQASEDKDSEDQALEDKDSEHQASEDKDSGNQDSKGQGPEDTSIDWSRVTRVRIIWIGDYHD